MNIEKKSVDSSSRFIERMIGIAGGAILAGSLGVLIFNSLDGYFPNALVAAIAGVAGGVVNILQRLSIKRNGLEEKSD